MLKYINQTVIGITKTPYDAHAFSQKIKVNTTEITERSKIIRDSSGICKANKRGYHKSDKKYTATAKTAPFKNKFSVWIDCPKQSLSRTNKPAETPNKNSDIIYIKLNNHIGGNVIFPDII